MEYPVIVQAEDVHDPFSPRHRPSAQTAPGLHERGHPPLREQFEGLSPDSIAVSVVTVEEALRGRLAVLARLSAGQGRERASAKRMETVRFIGSIPAGRFDARCEQQVQPLARRGT